LQRFDHDIEDFGSAVLYFRAPLQNTTIASAVSSDDASQMCSYYELIYCVASNDEGDQEIKLHKLQKSCQHGLQNEFAATHDVASLALLYG
jgi:hypothetical protein